MWLLLNNCAYNNKNMCLLYYKCLLRAVRRLCCVILLIWFLLYNIFIIAKLSKPFTHANICIHLLLLFFRITIYISINNTIIIIKYIYTIILLLCIYINKVKIEIKYWEQSFIYKNIVCILF